MNCTGGGGGSSLSGPPSVRPAVGSAGVSPPPLAPWPAARAPRGPDTAGEPPDPPPASPGPVLDGDPSLTDPLPVPVWDSARPASCDGGEAAFSGTVMVNTVPVRSVTRSGSEDPLNMGSVSVLLDPAIAGSSPWAPVVGLKYAT